jgi:hypothetical protein
VQFIQRGDRSEELSTTLRPTDDLRTFVSHAARDELTVESREQLKITAIH